MNGYGVPWMSLSFCFSLVVSLFLAFIRCRAVAIDMLRLTVCWNHIDGVAVWCVSPYVSVDSSLHMALTPCSRCCGECEANVYAWYANSFVLDRSEGLFHGGLVGGNCVSGIPRNSWAVYPSRPR